MRLCILGASGKMGQSLIKLLQYHKEIELVGAITHPSCPLLGQDVGDVCHIGTVGVAFGAALETALDRCDMAIDFSTPEASCLYLEQALKRSVPFVTGTTGFKRAQEELFIEAAQHLPIVKSGNMSLGVNLLAALAKKAAHILDESFDIEILEMHHRQKVDAPSGTALLLAEAAAKGRQIPLASSALCEASGKQGPRRENSIGFASLRGGTVVGEHSVIFAGDHERIVLSHIAENRQIFARGALHAAFWLRDKRPGLYSMADVLGLTLF